MYPNGTVPTESGRYMEDERHSTRRLGKMKSKMIMASLLAILMVVTVVPMTFSEDSDALTGDSNIWLMLAIAAAGAAVTAVLTVSRSRKMKNA